MSSENEAMWHPSGWSPVFHGPKPSTDAAALIGFTRLRVLGGAERVTVTRSGLLYFGWSIVDSNGAADAGDVWLL